MPRNIERNLVLGEFGLGKSVIWLLLLKLVIMFVKSIL